MRSASSATICPPERALELGLVNKVVPANQLQAEAHALGREDRRQRAAGDPRDEAPLPPRPRREDFESHSHHVLMQLLLLFRSQDFQEGIASFMEKRPPQFVGR